MRVDYELVLGIAFLAFFAWVVWRGGSTNPVGTGHLQRQMQALGVRMGRVEKTVDGCALSSEVEKLRGEISEMEKRVASSGEVVALEGQMAAMNMRIAGLERTTEARMAGIEKLADRTDATVTRIEDYLRGRGGVA